ncbi:TIGR03086 family protein [Streptomyces sp. A7024]|uniref:TIGR03086 family protein n=1 Tax=Streptomyces coryli TaxID=1128680 RepID=A0A6G4TV68_9ACTN|nr:TIGR03086 family metal-binding protein [Streptomyces coryli]NGN63713.1 TIGR03086 family protein [Streptomyces coryli]
MNSGGECDDASAVALLTAGVSLLERGLGYALGNLSLVTPATLANPTPCADWDLRGLLLHLDDSLGALCEAAAAGTIAVGSARPPIAPAASADPVAAVRARGRMLLGLWSGSDANDRETISVGGTPLTAAIVTSTGAIETAVHGWDIARACGADRPLPEALAEELLELAPLFVSAADRPVRFALPREAGVEAGSGERLLAFLGRDPYGWP